MLEISWSYIDKGSGEIIECEVLVCVMPFSGLTYVGSINISTATQYFGGVPHSIKCDNLKSVVVKANRYEPKQIFRENELSQISTRFVTGIEWFCNKCFLFVTKGIKYVTNIY
ncbi:MAG: hypothetical protein IPG55_05080 [Saprospiraceae bacterium]|nr:hypothetical protein [Candidatus Defluviibacterium haderslevense]